MEEFAKPQPTSPSVDTYRKVVATLDQLLFFFTENHQALNHLPAWVWEVDSGGIDFAALRPLVVQAQAELAKYDEMLRLQNQVATDIMDEQAILSACALRFDGWEYQQISGFELSPALEHFWETDEWKLSHLEKLAAFYMLQRSLCKWDLVYEPQDGKYWRAFRILFFKVCHLDVTEDFRPQDPYWGKLWEYRYKPRLDECINVIKRIHETIHYDDDAQPFS